jgi:diacylglycerol diphosphate phosphatase / phosphatidate phosphatase
MEMQASSSHAPACLSPTVLKVARSHAWDWAVLALLTVVEVLLNVIEPFHRFVGDGMMTDLRYPLKSNTIPVWSVPVRARVSVSISFLTRIFNSFFFSSSSLLGN